MSDRFPEAPRDATGSLRSSAASAERELAVRYADVVNDESRFERSTALEEAHGPLVSDSLRAHEVLRALGRRLGAAACELWSTPEEGGLEVLESSWRDGQFATARPDISDPQGTSARPIAEVCESADWIVDIATDPRVERCEWMRANGLRALLRAPVRSERALLGSVRVYWRRQRVHDAAAADLVANGAGVLAGYLEQRASPSFEAAHFLHLEALGCVTSDALVVTDLSGRIVEVNTHAEVLLGRLRGELVGRALIELAVPERLRVDAGVALARLISEQRRTDAAERVATRMLLPNGQELAVSMAASVSHASNPPLLFLSAIHTRTCGCGVVGLEPTRAQLRSLMTSVLIAEDRERRRLAQDLHDGLSQLIALAQMKLAALRRTARSRVVDQRVALDEIQSLIMSADRAARSIGCELSPPSLHQLGLVPALRWLVENLHERYGVTIRFQDPQAPPTLDETRNVVLFRSVRELLINAAKHAQASSVALSVRETAGRLVVRVSDDGVGMENDIEHNSGTGLVSMRERLAHIGGALQIKSERGAGTTVEIELQLPVAADSMGRAS